MSVWQNAVLYRRAEAAYYRNFRDYFQSKLAPLSKQQFSAAVASFVHLVEAVRAPAQPTGWVHRASAALFRLPTSCADQSPNLSGWSLEEALCFARSWPNQQDVLHRNVLPLALARGPEYCERLSDALPLAGPQVSDALAAHELASFDALERSIERACGVRSWLADLILNAQYEWGQTLFESAQDCFAQLAAQEADELADLARFWTGAPL